MKPAEKERDILSYRFKYHGSWRHVDNVTLEDDYQTIVGREIRKDGKFSFQIKRFKMKNVESPLELMAPMQSERIYEKLAQEKSNDGISEE